MLVADVTFSPDDDGWYATIWNTVTGRPIETLPSSIAVFETEKELRKSLRDKYGSITTRNID